MTGIYPRILKFPEPCLEIYLTEQVLVDFVDLHVSSFRDYRSQGGEHEKRRRMKELVRAASIEEHKPEEEGQLVPQLFVRGQPCDHCVLVLTGRLQVVATADNFVSEAGPYRCARTAPLVLSHHAAQVGHRTMSELTILPACLFLRHNSHCCMR